MAGLVGICGSFKDSKQTVADAAALTVYSKKATTRALVQDENFILAESYFNFFGTEGRISALENNITACVAGEIYNIYELTNTGESFSDILLKSYREDNLHVLLPKVNGIFNAVIFDKKNKCLLIITDRYGLKPLYLYTNSKCLILAAELKCFPVFPSFKLDIKREVIDSYIDLQHFMGNETWFENVEVAAPATIYRYSLSDLRLSSKLYWRWSDVKQRSCSVDEAAEEMAMLLDSVNNDRFNVPARVGVALSGGLDSRAILAAVHKRQPITYTFGTSNSRDVKIARQVAALAGVKHFHYDTFVNGWLESRFSGIWKTDGLLNSLHMHYSHLMGSIANVMDVNLSGFLGDAVLGGSYLEKKGTVVLNQRITAQTAQRYYGKHYERCDINNPFFDINKIDAYLFYNRGRRMIGMGAEEPAKTIPQRLPFMDTALMDFSYSLPDEFRAHSKVYNKALLLKYPAFYENIPHSGTGVPIANHPTLSNIIKKKYDRLLWIAKYKLGMQTSYTNVHNWVREPDTAKLISNILKPENALYPSFTSQDYYKKYWMPHLNGKHNFIREVMGALTFEIWLQQILKKNFIPQSEY
jgi:asparagine synthase (glutamine-hydrolysing)